MYNFEYSPQYIALAQLRHALETDKVVVTKPLLDRLIKHGLDVDYSVPWDVPAARREPEFIGYTPLHFAARALAEEAVHYITQHGARVTVRNSNGYSPVRLALDNFFDCFEQPIMFLASKGMIKHPVMSSLLQAQLDQKDTLNPSCKMGVSHLHMSCMLDEARTVEFLLKSGASAEAAISSDSPHLAGYRPIHVAVRYCAVESLKLLLDNGADLWAREARGLNPLQLLVESNIDMMNIIDMIYDEYRLTVERIQSANDRMATLMLAQCEPGPFEDEFGLGRLHVAASMKDSTMLKEILMANAEIDVNAAISKNSPKWPGYTPLHFAADCGTEGIKILAERGGNLTAVDFNGVTPFDLGVTKYEPSVLYDIMQFDEMLKSARFHNTSTPVCEAVKALAKEDEVEAFLHNLININEPISLDSPLWPGRTLLHLSVTLMPSLSTEFDDVLKALNIRDSEERTMHCSTGRWEVITNLLTLGADPLLVDAQKISALHLATFKSHLNIIKEMFNALNLENDDLTDFDDLSLLHMSCVVADIDIASVLLKRGICNVNEHAVLKLNVRWWLIYLEDKFLFHFRPLSTPLHLAVTPQIGRFIKVLIEMGADPSAVDVDGVTPVQLVFIHSISLKGREEYLQERFVKCTKEISNFLFSTPLAFSSDVVSTEGLSHFHIACWSDSDVAVKSFLDRGVDINAKINCGLSDTYAENPCALKTRKQHMLGEECAKETLLMAPYAGYTPLHFAVQNKSLKVTELLGNSNADVHALNARGMSPLHMALTSNPPITASKMLKGLVARLDKSSCGTIDDYGITLLHVACKMQDVEWTKQLLIAGSNVNAQIAADSPVLPGYTPLHVLVARDNLDDSATFDVAELLIAYGADVTLPNAGGITPLHAIATTIKPNSNFSKIFIENNFKCYEVNQVDKNGLSFLHVGSIFNNVDMVTELLSLGEDVNGPTDYFEPSNGYGPLHYACINSNLEMVQLLIQKGADVRAEGRDGYTPLHALCSLCTSQKHNIDIISLLCEHGADVNATSVFGTTPLVVLLKRQASRFYDESIVHHLQSCGALLNTVNPMTGVGHLALPLFKGWVSADVLRRARDADILAVAENGSTAIHNSVRDHLPKNYGDYPEYFCMIEELVRRGCPINARDHQGKTALVVACEFKNPLGIRYLLQAGINPNIADNDGNEAFSQKEASLPQATITSDLQLEIHIDLLVHLHKFILLGLQVSELNRRVYERDRCGLDDHNYLNPFIDVLLAKIEKLEELELDGGISLREFLSERSLLKWKSILKMSREDIIRILVSLELDDKTYARSLRGPILYQYVRLLERADLIEPAKDALGVILDNVVPELCLDKILAFMDNEELKVLIDVL